MSVDPRSGSTLVEVVALLAVVAAAAVIAPAVVPGTGRPGLQAVAIEAAALLRRERWAAVVGREARDVRLDATARRLTARSGAVQLPPDVEVTVTGASREADPSFVVRFLPDGSATGGAVFLRRREAGREILVNWLTGRVTERAVPFR